MNAKELLFRSHRFDLSFKFLYALHRYDGEQAFAPYREMYLESIRLFNGFYEDSPLKNGAEDFLLSFDSLIESVRDNGFDDTFAIPIDILGNPLNGAHRLATAAALDLDVPVVADKKVIKPFCDDYRHFYARKRCADRKLRDRCAMEFVERNSLMRCMTIPKTASIGTYRRVHETIWRQGCFWLKRCGRDRELWLFIPNSPDFAPPPCAEGAKICIKHQDTIDEARDFFGKLSGAGNPISNKMRRILNPYSGV